MSGPIERPELLTAGNPIPEMGMGQSPFLIRLYRFAPLHLLLLWSFIYSYRVTFDGSRPSD